MTRIPAKAEYLTSPDFVPPFYRNASLFEMSKVAVLSFGMSDDDKVAAEESGAEVDRTKFRIVADAISCLNNHAVGGSQNGFAKTVVIFEDSPVGSVGLLIFIPDEKIISIPLIKNIPGMGIFLIHPAALNHPEPIKRKRKRGNLSIAPGPRKSAANTAQGHHLPERIVNNLKKETKIFSVGQEKEKTKQEGDTEGSQRFP